MADKGYHAPRVYQAIHNALFLLPKGDMLSARQMEVVEALAIEAAGLGFDDGFTAANNARWARDFQGRRLIEDSKGEADER